MSNFLDDEMKELLDSFIVETNEILDTLDQDLMNLESQSGNLDLLNSIFRSFHTIKGTSSFMGFEQITKITHEAEDLLNKLRRSELQVTPAIVDALLEVYDWLKKLIGLVQSGGDLTAVDYSATMATLHTINSGGQPVQKTVAPVNTSSEQNSGVAEAILSDPNFGSGPGYFSDEELERIQQAFNEVNQGLMSSPKSSETDDHSTRDAILSDPNFGSGSGYFSDDELAKIQEAFNEVNKEFLDSSAEQKTVVQPPPAAPIAAPAPAPVAKAAAPQPVKKEAEAAKTAPATQNNNQRAAAATENTIRVDVNRLEALMDLSGELVLGRNRLTQITQDMAQQYENSEYVRELQDTTSHIDFITTELQNAIMKTRMVQIGKLFQKAPRLIRELTKEFNKQIELVLRGEETELDRGIIEELNDPLVHMIRNSCDHGIEPPEAREAAGKDKKGTLILDAEHEGNNIVIRIIDDGKGMDPDFLKRKAVEKGLITTEQAQQLTDRETFNLIFAPGFSTAVKVTSVSGRGVGMDVVRTNIQKLKGLIEIDSKIGKGTTFTIKLPLTLAIIQGLLVRVEEEIYALPLSAVVEVVSVDQEKVYMINQNEVMRIRDQVIPLIRMDKLLKTPTQSNSIDNHYVVVVGLAEHRIGLIVDELLGQKEIVIKSLGEYLGQVEGISGSTILGDGRVIMIIDIEEIVNSHSKQLTSIRSFV